MPVYESNSHTKDGRKFFYRCYYKDSYGVLRQKNSKLYNGKRECEKAERVFLEEIIVQDEVDYNISFLTVYEEWLAVKQLKVKSSTFYSYKKKCDKHILSFFEKYKLHSINTTTILAWKKELFDKDNCIKEKNRIVSLLRDVLEYARDNYSFNQRLLVNLFLKKMKV